MGDAIYDVIVVGVGGVGSAVCHELAQAGISVLGIEQFEQGHDKGSTHGESRAIRKAYFEDPRYVPLMHRAYEKWKGLEVTTGQNVLFEVGCLIMGRRTSPVVQGCVQAAQKHQLKYEELSAAEIKNKYDIGIRSDHIGIFEPEGGYLYVDRCLKLIESEAKRYGAEIHYKEMVREFSESPSGVEVQTDQGSYKAKKLIVCAGAWVNRLLGFQFKIQRAVLFWLKQGKTKSHIPVFFHETEAGRWLYGFPPINGWVKLSYHDSKEECDPDQRAHDISKEEIEELCTDARSHLGIDCYTHGKTCMYTMTPDEHFAIGCPGNFKRTFVIGGLSGHGYKFAPVLGEIAAHFVLERSEFDIEFLSVNRLK